MDKFHSLQNPYSGIFFNALGIDEVTCYGVEQFVIDYVPKVVSPIDFNQSSIFKYVFEFDC